jgi:threonine/homoserine/homoserine lactone efflux protein
MPVRRLSAYFWQGFLVIWSNPKALFFFGAFIPQFVDQTQPAVPQVALLGLTFMFVGVILDGGYAVAAGKAASLLGAEHIRWLERASGTCMIGGGVWLLCNRSN